MKRKNILLSMGAVGVVAAVTTTAVVLTLKKDDDAISPKQQIENILRDAPQSVRELATHLEAKQVDKKTVVGLLTFEKTYPKSVTATGTEITITGVHGMYKHDDIKHRDTYKTELVDGFKFPKGITNINSTVHPFAFGALRKLPKGFSLPETVKDIGYFGAMLRSLPEGFSLPSGIKDMREFGARLPEWPKGFKVPQGVTNMP